MNPTLRRRIFTLGIDDERARLAHLVEAIAARAIAIYDGETIGSAWPHVERLAERYLRDAADLGAFRHFGVRDAADLGDIPPVLFRGAVPGTIGVRAHDVVTLIRDQGPRFYAGWVDAADLEFSGGAR